MASLLPSSAATVGVDTNTIARLVIVAHCPEKESAYVPVVHLGSFERFKVAVVATLSKSSGVTQHCSKMAHFSIDLALWVSYP